MRCERLPLVALDFNGTIQDDVKVGYEYSVRRPFTRARLPVPTFDEYRREYDSGDHMAFFRDRGLPGSNDESAFYGAVNAEIVAEDVRAPLFPEVMDVLVALHGRGCPMTIVSVLEQPILDASVARHGIGRFFRVVAGSLRSKAETIVAHHAEFGNGTPSFVVGDTIADARAAVAAGATPLICPRGLHHIDQIRAVQVELPSMVVIEDLFPLLQLVP